MENEAFWIALDTLVSQSELIIDRERGTKHPRYDFVYEIDYGYLKNTFSMDGSGIDVWKGTSEQQLIDAIICTVDLVKKDSEIKILIGCTEDEKNIILNFHNSTEKMKGIMLRRKQA